MNIQALLHKVTEHQRKKTVPDLRAGDTVRVHYKIKEGNKERIQVFEGLVIAVKSPNTVQGSFTVRKIASGVGVERTFPLHSPWIAKIERVKTGKVRRAKLYFVRRLATSPRKFRLKDKGIEGTVWADVVDTAEPTAESTEDATEATVAEPAPTSDNAGNDVSDESAGEPSGATSSDVAATPEEVSDSSPESQN